MPIYEKVTAENSDCKPVNCKFSSALTNITKLLIIYMNELNSFDSGGNTN